MTLGDFILAPVCSIEEATLCVSITYLMWGAETGEGIANLWHLAPGLETELVTFGLSTSILSIKPSFYPSINNARL